MSTTSARLLDHRSLSEGDTMSSESAADLSEGHTLEVVVTVHSAGEGDSPTLCLRHAPDSADESWLEFPEPMRISPSRPGRYWLHASRYTRYVGWALNGTLTADAEVTVDLIAKS